MYVDLPAYFRVMYLSLFRAGDVYHRPKFGRKVGLVFFFLVFFPLFSLFTAVCLLLDHVFFPGFRRVNLDKALFLVGHPRSGTTYLQQLIAKDDSQFFGIRTWEAFFPSVLQKKVLAAVGRLDRALGGRLKAGIERREQRRTETFAHIHDMGLFKLTEDDRFFMHTFTSHGLLWFLHPGAPGWQFHFDEQASERNRDRAMRFFRACMKRQAYFKGGRRFLMSKSPFASLRVRSLHAYFPGCRIIYTVRNPLESVPSMLNFGKTYWDSDPNLKDWDRQQRWIYDCIREMYRHPLAVFQQADPANWDIVRYEDLMQETRRTVKSVYEKFGYAVSPEFEALLQKENETQRTYRSKHRTTLAEFNLSREQVLEDFKEVFEQCRFDAKGEPAA